MKKLMMAAAAAVMIAPVVGAFGGHGETPHFDAAKLEKILDTRPDEMKARYKYRHPQATLEFFGVAPGMTVADILPGEQWYSGILLPYLGKGGHMIGTDYSTATWTGYQGDRENAAEWVEKRKGWAAEWSEKAQGWRKDGDAKISAMVIDQVPADLIGKIDVFMAMRALHLPNRFEGEVSSLAKNAFAALKPGGVFGVVQHRAPEGNSDDWSRGQNGYLKQAALIATVTAAGFEFVGSKEFNANPNDKPTHDDGVWRLPPSYSDAKEGSEQRAKVDAIGESDRMTLKFRKPA